MIIKIPEPEWICRFHPTDWFHEVGCPHMKWTKKQLKGVKKRIKKNQL